MGAGGEKTKGMKRVTICPLSETISETKKSDKLKHKNSEKFDECSGDDLERQASCKSDKQLLAVTRARRGGGGRGRGGGRGGAKTALFWVVGVLGVLLLLEVMLAIAIMVGPMTGMMTEVKEALSIVTDNRELIGAGLGILAPSGAPSVDDGSSSVFLQWCKSSPCMTGDDKADLCESVDNGLASARGENGLPILPFPSTFCDAVDILSSNQCLCDPNLGNKTITGDAAQIVQFSGAIENMCDTKLTTPSSEEGCP